MYLLQWISSCVWSIKQLSFDSHALLGLSNRIKLWKHIFISDSQSSFLNTSLIIMKFSRRVLSAKHQQITWSSQMYARGVRWCREWFQMHHQSWSNQQEESGTPGLPGMGGPQGQKVEQLLPVERIAKAPEKGLPSRTVDFGGGLNPSLIKAAERKEDKQMPAPHCILLSPNLQLAFFTEWTH